MDEVEKLYKFLKENAPVLFITGAGCSTDSGIPDYRDKNGGWKRSLPIHLSDFLSSEQARKRYWARSMGGWSNFEAAKPNEIHFALAQLERKGLVTAIVTQNVDELHQRAGSKNVVPLHGTLSTVSCNGCDKTYCRAGLQGRLHQENPGFIELKTNPGPDGDADLDTADVSNFQVPCCDVCSGILQPDVVFYGGVVPKERLDLVATTLDRSRAVLIVGSSVMVFSSYRICRSAYRQGKPIAALNEGVTRADDLLELQVRRNAGQVLSALSKKIEVAL